MAFIPNLQSDDFYIEILEIFKGLNQWQLFIIILVFLLFRFLRKLTPQQVDEILEALKEFYLYSVEVKTKKETHKTPLETENNPNEKENT